jgi:hypothetical protein
MFFMKFSKKILPLYKYPSGMLFCNTEFTVILVHLNTLSISTRELSISTRDYKRLKLKL